MSREVELKLALSNQDLDALRAQDLISQYSTCNEVKHLRNQYFDTPDQQLTSEGFALRIRKSGDQYIQTLKGKGSNIAGLHQRLELDWTLPTDKLDLSLIPEDVLPATIERDKISPLFTTDFSREMWMLKDDECEVEMVLDIGEVKAGPYSDPICEIELELKRGEIKSLFELARALGRTIPMVPSDTSKAERGYRLVNKKTEFKVFTTKVEKQQTLEQAFIALMASDLGVLQRQWEAFHFSQNWSYLYEFRNTLGNLRSNMTLFTSILPPEGSGQFVEGLAWLEEQMNPILSWWPACFALSKQAKEEPRSASEQLQQSKAWQALDRLEALERQPEFGMTLLYLSEWLHNQGWKEFQTPDQKNMSNQDVQSALLGPLKEQWQNLNLNECRGNVSSWLERKAAIQGLAHVCQKLGSLTGSKMTLDKELHDIENNLSELSAMEVVHSLGDWLQRLSSEEKESINSWARSQTIVIRDLNLAAQKLMASL